MFLCLNPVFLSQAEREKRPADAIGDSSKNPAAKGGTQDTPKKNGASLAAARPDSDDESSDDD